MGNFIDDLERLKKAANKDWTVVPLECPGGDDYYEITAGGKSVCLSADRQTLEGIAATRNALPRMIAVWRAAEEAERAFAKHHNSEDAGNVSYYDELLSAMLKVQRALAGKE